MLPRGSALEPDFTTIMLASMTMEPMGSKAIAMLASLFSMWEVAAPPITALLPTSNG